MEDIKDTTQKSRGPLFLKYFGSKLRQVHTFFKIDPSPASRTEEPLHPLALTREPLPWLQGKIGTGGQPVKHAGKQGRDKMASKTLPVLEWLFPECTGPSRREQASPYLCVFRAENSSEMMCFKKLKQKKKI